MNKIWQAIKGDLSNVAFSEILQLPEIEEEAATVPPVRLIESRQYHKRTEYFDYLTIRDCL